MKKLLILFIFFTLFGVVNAAETLKMQATSLAYKSINRYGDWTEWSQWEDCNILVVIKEDRVNIYSKVPQEYDIYYFGKEESDNEGGRITTLKCVDMDGQRCGMRLRIQSDGQIQFYVDYSDFMFVYNVEFK